MRAYIQITGIIFAVVTLAHGLRLALNWSVQVADWVVPMWMSWVAILVAGALSFRAFQLVSRAPQ